jgi:hypothetical protein
MEQSFSEQGLQIYFVRQSEIPSEYFLDAFNVSELAIESMTAGFLQIALHTLIALLH